MNEENKKICDGLNNLYQENSEFYKWVRDTADRFENYTKMPDVKYTSLVMTIIATWESIRNKFTKEGKVKKYTSADRMNPAENQIVDKTKEGGACIF